jgi:hypothetical protein
MSVSEELEGRLDGHGRYGRACNILEITRCCNWALFPACIWPSSLHIFLRSLFTSVFERAIRAAVIVSAEAILWALCDGTRVELETWS